MIRSRPTWSPSLLLVALEGLLSADNAMVLAVLVLGLPKSQQKQALRYGILGAFVFRGLATLLAVYLIELAWVKIVGAGYLLFLVYQPLRDRRDGRGTAHAAEGAGPGWASARSG